MPTNGNNSVYDGPAVVKEIELAEPDEESKPVFIALLLLKISPRLKRKHLKCFLKNSGLYLPGPIMI